MAASRQILAAVRKFHSADRFNVAWQNVLIRLILQSSHPDVSFFEVKCYQVIDFEGGWSWVVFIAAKIEIAIDELTETKWVFKGVDTVDQG